MIEYVVGRGLDAVRLLVENFPNRVWWLPNLICEEVIDEIEGKVKALKYYPVYTDFKLGIPEFGEEPSIFYVVDYFGKEFGPAEQNQQAHKFRNRDVITIRDSVWFPFPFSPLGPNQIWFNSWRKIKKGTEKSAIISPHGLGNELLRAVLASYLNWSDVELRYANFAYLRKSLGRFRVKFDPEFPTLFPLRVKNRDIVLPLLEQIAWVLDVELPGLWGNRRGLYNRLYEELLWLDCRHTREQLDSFVQTIERAGVPA